MTRMMHMGVFVLGTGNHVAGWRMPGAFDSFQDLPMMQQVARIAERGTFDLFFLGDGLAADLTSHPSFTARFEPITLLAALAATTTHLGLGATTSTTYSDPSTVARFFASLDHLSGGRAAWNAVTSSNAKAAPNFGREHPRHDARYDVAEEFIDVVRGLWDGWDDGAIVADRATGRYFDLSRIRALNHNGAHFQVQGPLNIARCPQGRPVILQAGSSGPGLALAARTADVVFSVVQDMAEAQLAYTTLKRQVAECGRDPASVTVLPGVMPVLGRTSREARDKLNTLQAFVDSDNAAGMLRMRLGVESPPGGLDNPVPADLPLPDSSHGFARAILGKALREGMTWRDLQSLVGAARGHWVLCGTAAEVADTLQHWFENGAADGFNIMPAWFPGAFDEFVDEVVPILRERGLFRRHYSGRTLREHLGLPRPSL